MTAAWSRSTSGQSVWLAYWPSEGTGAPLSGDVGDLPHPPACGTVKAS